jgi:trehalose 6-phosphate phosphatase
MLPVILPPFRSTALLLDLDGTLLDMAPTPDLVVVPPGLTDTLRAIRGQLDDGLAVVTGRPIETIDLLLGDAPYAVAGEHGVAIRHGPGAVIERPDVKPPPPDWIDRAEALTAEFPGTILERKARGFGVHFRLAPQAGPAIQQALTEMVAGSAGFELMHSQMLYEVRPRAIDKGTAVTSLMRRAPFLGRRPVFIGDDLTDEDGMRVARAMGGVGLKVQDVFGVPACVRAWLHETAVQGDWGALP